MDKRDFDLTIHTSEDLPDNTFHGGMMAERDRIIAYLEARAVKLSRHGGKASARQLRVAAQDLRAGLHRDG